MPQAVVPALLAGVTAGSTFTLAAGLTVGFSTTAFVTSMVLSAASQALAPKPKIPNIGGGGNGGVDQSKTVTARQSNATRKLVYGETRIGGTFAFLESTDSDEYLHVVIVVAAHEINQFTTIFFNDEELTISGGNVTSPSKYNGFANVHTVTKGTAGNIPSLLLATPSWTANHKLTDQAYIYCRLKFDPDAFPQGLPNISAKVQGRKVYDTRTSTTAFSRNPAMIIRNYLLDDTYGLGVTAAEIDDASFEAAANICDETVALSGGGTETRYQFDGVVDTQNTPRGNLEQMLTALNGALYYTNGKWNLRAGAYVTPTVTLDEDDLAAGLTVTTSNSARDSFNAIKGQFISPDSDYQATDYPAVTSTTFETEDNSEQRFLNLDLPFTSSAVSAQRIAKQILYKNRQEIAVKARFKMTAFQFQVGDTVMITNARLGWSQKVFEVITWRLNFDQDQATIDCELAETNSAVYTWTAEESDFQQDNTTLPSAFLLPAPSLVLSDTLQTFNQKAVSVLQATVTTSSLYAARFEVEAKKSTDVSYISIGSSLSNLFELIDVEDNAVYDVRARSVSSLGVRSPYATAQRQIVGKSAPPSDVTNFSINIVGNTVHLSWTPVADLDLSHYRIRHSPLTTGATFANATDLIAKVSRPANTTTAPALTGTYFIKAVDKLGNESTNDAQQVAIIDAIGNFNVVETSNQHTAFAGAKSSTVTVDDKLLLDTSINFDSETGNFDDAQGLFDGGGGTVASSGTYDFDNVIDLSAVYTSRVTSSITVDRLDYVDLFDSAAGNFDDRSGDFDGDPQAFGDTNVELQISTTEDDPSGTPTWTAYRKFVVGSYKARAFRFKAILSTTNPEATPAISALSVTVDMPDLFLSGNDIASGTGAKVITFTPAFKVLQGLGISAQNLQSGDYYAITSKTASGFTITFYNSSATIVDRTFDYVAKGY